MRGGRCAPARTAGRTTFFAGATLFAALALSAFVQPGSLLLSLATAVGVATALSVIVAGRRPSRPARPARHAHQRRRDRPRAPPAPALPGRRRGCRGPAPPGLRRAPDRRPAGPARRARPRLQHRRARDRRAAHLQRGAPERRNDRPTRSAPAGKRRSSSSPPPSDGPITTRERLALLSRWQRRIAGQPGVRAVIGPGADRRAAPARCASSARP